MSTDTTLREAGPADADRIAALVNRAFLAESWFKSVDRTNTAQVQGLLSKGVFLLLEDGARLLACVYLEPRGDRVYLGMLSVEQDVQGRGIGRRMMHEAEEYSRRAGHVAIDLRIVHLREELPPYYRKFGYVETGTEPAPDFPGVKVPIHFVLMSKSLQT
ncbi:MAG TPA: GNAT family N-acetyltransferase [Acidobacteriaceae bacterium]|nr:GNAT family N-acetyltransferase [Acidobacteriaceae bacterium]